MYELGKLGQTLETRTLLTPAEASRALDETTDAWNVLRNELYGRAANPRTDVPIGFQSEVLREYTAYRKFADNLGAFDAITNNYSAELVQWRQIYNRLRARWNLMSVTTMAPELAPTTSPGGAVLETMSSTGKSILDYGWPVILTTGAVAIVVLGWKAWLARPARTIPRRRFARAA